MVSEVEPPDTAQVAYIPDPRRWRILSVLLVTIFMSLIGVSIVNVALPSIQLSLDASQSQIQWVLSGYALTFGVVLIAAGRAGDLYGRGALFIVGVAVFTLSSAAAGLAPDANTLNGARLLQGIGSGFMGPQALGMIQQYFRGAERGKAFGLFGSTVGVSVATGNIMGGLLIQAFGVDSGWRWTFFVNVPVGILAIALAFAWFPKPLIIRTKKPKKSVRSSEPRKPKDLDVVGGLLAGLAVLTVLMPFTQRHASAFVWLLLPLSALLVWAWIRWERAYKARGRSPMVDLDIFRTPSFTNGTLLITLYFLGITSIFVLVALYMQDGLGHTALESGAIGLPGAVMTMIAANWGGRNVMRYGRTVVIGGMIAALVGLILSILVVQLREAGVASEWWLLLTLAIVGAGQGAVISPNQTLTLEDVPLQYAGSSGGIMQTGQRIGTSVGITVITTIAFFTLARSDWAGAATAGFSAICFVIILALLVALYDSRVRRATSSD